MFDKSSSIVAVIPSNTINFIPTFHGINTGMLPIAGKPIISTIISFIKQQGIRDIVIIIGNNSSDIVLGNYIHRTYNNDSNLSIVLKNNILDISENRKQLIISRNVIIQDCLIFNEEFAITHIVND